MYTIKLLNSPKDEITRTEKHFNKVKGKETKKCLSLLLNLGRGYDCICQRMLNALTGSQSMTFSHIMDQNPEKLISTF